MQALLTTTRPFVQARSAAVAPRRTVVCVVRADAKQTMRCVEFWRGPSGAARLAHQGWPACSSDHQARGRAAAGAAQLEQKLAEEELEHSARGVLGSWESQLFNAFWRLGLTALQPTAASHGAL